MSSARTAGGPYNERLRGFLRTALGPVVVIWGFGYILVDIVVVLMGRTAPGVNMLASVPMFALGVGLTVTLDGLRQETRPVHPLLAWPLLVAACVVAAAIQSSFDHYWMRWLALSFVPSWQEWALEVTRQRLLTSGILYLWTFALALTVLWSTRSSVAAEAAAARAASAQAAAAKAEAAALRLQLNPHFLFNTLNSISSLVVAGRRDDAEEMIERLSEFLRASLEADPTADVPLAQEIDTVDAYLNIEAARFGERLDVEFAVEPGTTEAKVPNFILQPLVENAVKYGVARVRGPACLRVSAARDGGNLLLSVVNARVGEGAIEAERAPTSTGIGLANVRQRLAARYGDGAGLETEVLPDGYRASVRLPFLA